MSHEYKTLDAYLYSQWLKQEKKRKKEENVQPEKTKNKYNFIRKQNAT